MHSHYLNVLSAMKVNKTWLLFVRNAPRQYGQMEATPFLYMATKKSSLFSGEIRKFHMNCCDSITF